MQAKSFVVILKEMRLVVSGLANTNTDALCIWVKRGMIMLPISAKIRVGKMVVAGAANRGMTVRLTSAAPMIPITLWLARNAVNVEEAGLWRQAPTLMLCALHKCLTLETLIKTNGTVTHAELKKLF